MLRSIFLSLLLEQRRSQLPESPLKFGGIVADVDVSGRV